MKEQLENLKNDLEQLKIYSKKSLLLVFNQDTKKYEILYLKNEETTLNQTSTQYKNLNGEVIKIISKKGYLGIKPKKYSFKNRNLLKTILACGKEFYFLEELKEIEEQLNQDLKNSRNR